jgi:hypothetical protein
MAIVVLHACFIVLLFPVVNTTFISTLVEVPSPYCGLSYYLSSMQYISHLHLSVAQDK